MSDKRFERSDLSSPLSPVPWKRFVLPALMLLTAAVYAPGLWGSFIFDDSSFIFENTRLQVRSLHLGEWVSAALSFPSGSHVGRWLGMLSFAANHYFTGLDPFWMKLTNLGIHLANGVLVFLMLRSLFALREECHPERPASFDARLAAAAIAGIWLVLPINLTAVLYVSQRLESLSTTFIFLGLWLYLRARLRLWRGERGAAGLWASLVICTGLGVLVKESAVMLPLYAACVELAVTGARTRDGRISRPVAILYAVLVGIPLVAGSIWLLSWIGGASSFARPFDTMQRLMTEARVLVGYIQWTLLPQPEALTLYHDDIAVSHGLLDPPTTLAAIAALAALLGAAIWQRSRRPLFALGIFWFFGGHLLTGTVIPLMLIMEHRNYFPSVGLLLAVASLIGLEGGLQRVRVRIAIVACALAFYSFTTWMRAEEWSDPLRLALSEANKRPDSSAAQYELGRTLLYSTRNGESAPMISQGFDVLERASHIPNSDILHEQLLITGHAELHLPIEPRWWVSLLEKLKARPPTSADIGALDALFRCQVRHVCPLDLDRLRNAFEAATSWPSADGVLLSLYGAFAEHAIHEPAVAEAQYRAAMARAPGEPLNHTNLVRFLVSQGRRDEARGALDALRKLNFFGSLDRQIGDLDSLLTGTGPADATQERGTSDPDAKRPSGT